MKKILLFTILFVHLGLQSKAQCTVTEISTLNDNNSFNKINPQIENGNIVWRGNDPESSTSQIYLANCQGLVPDSPVKDLPSMPMAYLAILGLVVLSLGSLKLS
ncbi:MAG: hypothetical protein Sapg2KO_09180 [Saprospiraceae bacterium]